MNFFDLYPSLATDTPGAAEVYKTVVVEHLVALGRAELKPAHFDANAPEDPIRRMQYASKNCLPGAQCFLDRLPADSWDALFRTGVVTVRFFENETAPDAADKLIALSLRRDVTVLTDRWKGQVTVTPESGVGVYTMRVAS